MIGQNQQCSLLDKARVGAGKPNEPRSVQRGSLVPSLLVIFHLPSSNEAGARQPSIDSRTVKTKPAGTTLDTKSLDAPSIHQRRRYDTSLHGPNLAPSPLTPAKPEYRDLNLTLRLSTLLSSRASRYLLFTPSLRTQCTSPLRRPS